MIPNQSQQIYFNEPEPQIQDNQQNESSPEKQYFYSSCLFNKHPSPLTFTRRASYKEQSSQRPLPTTLQRKMTSYQQSITKVQSGYQSVNKNSPVNKYKHFTKLQSISPDILTKNSRHSQSPNRKNLYWQSWMLVHQTPKNLSNIGSKTMNIQTNHLPKITASAYMAYLQDSSQIMIRHNQQQKRQIASLTKIMTAYTVINICNNNGLRVRDHKIIIHQQASYMQGTSANLRKDQQLLIIDLLYGLLLPSGNDAGVALAQYFGKFLSFKLTKQYQKLDIEDVMEKFESYRHFYDIQYQRDSIRLFVSEMNKNSFKIGLKNTRFDNPTGLSNCKNHSTAEDMSILTAHCLKNTLMREIFKKKVYTCEVVNQKMGYKRQIQWKNTNKHLYQFRECIGAKTGITPTAGPCLSSVYRIMNKQLVVIVLNSASIQDRYEDAKSIYKWCRRQIKQRMYH